MIKNVFFYTLFFLQGSFVSLEAIHSDRNEEPISIRNWGQSSLLAPTERRSARTAILIIAPPVIGDCFTENRWKIGRKVWEQYMQSHPNVDCYFIQSTYPRADRDSSNQIWLEGNTIYVGDWWYEKYMSDRILHKTIVAMEWLLPNYTHFIRTNLNTFFNLKVVNEYMETHHESFYTTPLWQNEWYAIGYAVLYTADVADHMVSEYRRLEAAGESLISSFHADDCAMTALASGVYPYGKKHPFRCCPNLPFGTRQLMCQNSLSTKRLSQYGTILLPPVSLNKAIDYCEQGSDTMMVFRIREGLSLQELGQFYQYLLQKSYPELYSVNIVEYCELFNKKN